MDDLEAAVAHLRQDGVTGTVGLWGRSMGAVTALLFSQRDPSIAGIVSPSWLASGSLQITCIALQLSNCRLLHLLQHTSALPRGNCAIRGGRCQNVSVLPTQNCFIEFGAQQMSSSASSAAYLSHCQEKLLPSELDAARMSAYCLYAASWSRAC